MKQFFTELYWTLKYLEIYDNGILYEVNLWWYCFCFSAALLIILVIIQACITPTK
ncbi:MAG: hypothetical protein LBU65_17740 [Planctomycetaceae bacterium]|nr:hypothetical protein [Planctomycetaceae bacterium]